MQINEPTTHEVLKHFCKAIITISSPVYLCALPAEDQTYLLQVGDSRGFHRMLISFDYIYWKWHNYPTT
jgi:hypothetical protein